MLVVQLFVSKCQSSFEPVVFWPSSIKILKVKRFALTCFPWNYSSKITRIFPPKTKILMRKMEPSNCYMVCSHRFTCFFVSKLLLLFLYLMEKNKILLQFFFFKYSADQMHAYSHYSLREGEIKQHSFWYKQITNRTIIAWYTVHRIPSGGIISAFGSAGTFWVDGAVYRNVMSI